MSQNSSRKKTQYERGHEVVLSGRWRKKRCCTCALFDSLTWVCSGLLATVPADGLVVLADPNYKGPSLQVRTFPEFGCNGHRPHERDARKGQP